MRGARDTNSVLCHKDTERGWEWHEMRLETLAGPNQGFWILTALRTTPPQLSLSQNLLGWGQQVSDLQC